LFCSPAKRLAQTLGFGGFGIEFYQMHGTTHMDAYHQKRQFFELYRSNSDMESNNFGAQLKMRAFKTTQDFRFFTENNWLKRITAAITLLERATQIPMTRVFATTSPKANTVFNIPHIIAHRGASIEAPENTIAAFRVAGARKAKWVECDVTLSADDKCVLIHDETLERTTNGTGPVYKSDLTTLRGLDAGAWFSDIYKGERIPTLTDTLETLYFMEMGANLEIKPSGCDPVRLCHEVIAELKRAKDLPILISSFDDAAVAEMRTHAPEIPCGWLIETLPENWKSEYERLGASAIHIDHKALTPVSAAEIVDARVPLVCYTINDVERAKELFSWGVTSVITDDPATLFAAMPYRPLPSPR